MIKILALQLIVTYLVTKATFQIIYFFKLQFFI